LLWSRTNNQVDDGGFTLAEDANVRRRVLEGVLGTGCRVFAAKDNRHLWEALTEAANQAEPLYLRSILGGFSTVRGFETGFLTGDKMAAGSIEWRIPVRSPLRVGKIGVTAFFDAGTAWDHGQAFVDQHIYKGAGGTAWFSVASFRLSMAVGYGFGSGTHVHFSGGIGF